MSHCGRRDESGSVTLFVLGLSVTMLFIGGLSLDLWRAFSERTGLAGAVDAAAVAGASGIDTNYFRQASQVRLDPAMAESLAQESLAAQSDLRALVDAQVEATTTEVTVSATGRVDFTLLRIFMDSEPFTVRVRATARPELSS